MLLMFMMNQWKLSKQGTFGVCTRLEWMKICLYGTSVLTVSHQPLLAGAHAANHKQKLILTESEHSGSRQDLFLNNKAAKAWATALIGLDPRA